MTRRTVHAVARGVLRRSGLDLRLQREAGRFRLDIEHARIAPPSPRATPLPKLFTGPVDALYYGYGGKPAAFVCPLDQCVDVNGLNFRDSGWHPFTELLYEHARDGVSAYEGSALERYYERWQPANLLEAFVGLEQSPGSKLHTLPSHLTYHYPWSAKSIAEADEAIRNNFYQDNVEHGRPDLTVEAHGCKGHGPISKEAGQLEVDRLVRIYGALAREGYRREHGDIRVLAVKRGDQYRYVVSGGGLHRVAALKALGYRTAPAVLNNVPAIFDVADAAHWPQVSDGPWSERTAANYIDQLFDFDAYAWAQRLGLITCERTLAGPAHDAHTEPEGALARWQEEVAC